MQFCRKFRIKWEGQRRDNILVHAHNSKKIWRYNAGLNLPLGSHAMAWFDWQVHRMKVYGTIYDFFALFINRVPLLPARVSCSSSLPSSFLTFRSLHSLFSPLVASLPLISPTFPPFPSIPFPSFLFASLSVACTARLYLRVCVVLEEFRFYFLFCIQFRNRFS